MTDFVIPVIVAAVLIFGAIRKTDVFAEFTEGVKEGLHTVYEIFPALFCLVVTIAVFKASGGISLITGLLSPLLSMVGFPAECVPLALLRPFSGSGGVAILQDILTECGADSRAGTIASVIMGSSETTFYTLSVYFTATKVKNTRYALPAALCGDIAGIIFSGIVVGIIL